MLHFIGIVFLISVALAIIVRFPLVLYFMTFILTLVAGFLILAYTYGSYDNNVAAYALCGAILFFGFGGAGALLVKVTPAARPVALGLFYGSVIPALASMVLAIATKLHFL